MAVAETPTLLSLDRFGAIVGFDPLHWNGVIVNEINAQTVCGTPIFQTSYQDNKIGREDVARAIADAERMIADALGYWPMPQWIQNERWATIRPAIPELVRTNSVDSRGYWIPARARWKYIISGGRRAVETPAIDEGAAIVYSDAPPIDGYDETATVEVTTDVADCEVHVFYPGKAGNPLWEIRPATVTSDAGTTTIVFRREQAVIEGLLDRIRAAFPTTLEDFSGGIDGTDDDNFLTTVDVYRVWNDPQLMGRLEWEPRPGTCGCGEATCPECTVQVQVACLTTRGDTRDGLFSYVPATWDEDEEQFTRAAFAVCRDPDRVLMWYRAGWQYEEATCPFREMDPRWELAIARLATTLIPGDLCGCKHIEEWLGWWRQDLARVGEFSFQVNPEVLGNPFGTRRGAVWAWNQVNANRQAVAEVALI